MGTGPSRILLNFCWRRYAQRIAQLKCIFDAQRKIPDEGWPDNRIEMLLSELSMMDSNNFPGNVIGSSP